MLNQNNYQAKNRLLSKCCFYIGLLGVIISLTIGWLIAIPTALSDECSANCGVGWMVLFGAMVIFPGYLISELLLMANAIKKPAK